MLSVATSSQPDCEKNFTSLAASTICAIENVPRFA
jgi:hypothetical protein